MNRVMMMLVVVALAVQPAMASQDIDAELAEMRELVEGLKDKVDAQEEQLSHQGGLLEEAQQRITEDEGSKSGLSSFVDSLVVSGLVAGGYNYNLNDPDHTSDGDDFVNSGESESFLPFQPDHNTFSVDQVVFDLSKPATAESRAGFGFQMLFGNTATMLGQAAEDNSESFRDDNQDATSDYYVSEAYLEYLAPCGCGDGGINFTLGKFQSNIGSEVYQLNSNYNISRGAVYSLLQPVDNLGIKATADLGPIEITGGLLSSGFSSHSNLDDNSEKTYMVSLAAGDDRLNGRVTYQFGAEGNNPSGSDMKLGLVDGVLNFNPASNVGVWVNTTYLYEEGSRAAAFGVAVAGRVEVIPGTGIAVRGEYLQDQVSSTSGNDGLQIQSGNDRSKIWTATVTVDHALTDSLKLMGEYRWDKVEEENFEEFLQGDFDGNGTRDDDQGIFLLEAVYSF